MDYSTLWFERYFYRVLIVRVGFNWEWCWSDIGIARIGLGMA